MEGLFLIDIGQFVMHLCYICLYLFASLVGGNAYAGVLINLSLVLDPGWAREQ